MTNVSRLFPVKIKGVKMDVTKDDMYEGDMPVYNFFASKTGKMIASVPALSKNEAIKKLRKRNKQDIISHSVSGPGLLGGGLL